jgi:hypothetical protein
MIFPSSLYNSSSTAVSSSILKWKKHDMTPQFMGFFVS